MCKWMIYWQIHMLRSRREEREQLAIKAETWNEDLVLPSVLQGEKCKQEAQ